MHVGLEANAVGELCHLIKQDGCQTWLPRPTKRHRVPGHDLRQGFYAGPPRSSIGASGVAGLRRFGACCRPVLPDPPAVDRPVVPACRLRSTFPSENPLKVTRLASALVAAAFGLVSLNALADVPAPQDVAYPGTLKISVDATDLAHRIFRVHEVIPAQPGR